MRSAPIAFVRWGAPSPSELGQVGEEIGARWLVARGWRILARRQRTRLAEIDLVASHKRELVCVEVKTGRGKVRRVDPGPQGLGSPAWRPGDRFSARSLERQQRAGVELARAWGRGALRGGRVDLLEVFFEPGRARPQVVHHERLEGPIP